MRLQFFGLHARAHDLYCIGAVNLAEANVHPVGDLLDGQQDLVAFMVRFEPVWLVEQPSDDMTAIEIHVPNPHMFYSWVVGSGIEQRIPEGRFDSSDVQGWNDPSALPRKLAPEVSE